MSCALGYNGCTGKLDDRVIGSVPYPGRGAQTTHQILGGQGRVKRAEILGENSY